MVQILILIKFWCFGKDRIYFWLLEDQIIPNIEKHGQIFVKVKHDKIVGKWINVSQSCSEFIVKFLH